MSYNDTLDPTFLNHDDDTVIDPAVADPATTAFPDDDEVVLPDHATPIATPVAEPGEDDGLDDEEEDLSDDEE